MHIPDGYISPTTVVVMYAAAAPFWYQAARKVKDVLKSQAAPFVAVFAAFSFVVQMLNIPIPGGTTAHAVGAVLMAVVLGPWAAIIGVSTALVIQAFFFGDGGITAIGANCFNMAIAMPLAGYAIYRLVSRGAPSDRRRAIAAAAGGYVGINVAAFLTALELGLQPVFWSEAGRALYNPYGLEVTMPTMVLVHLTIVGFVEAAVTGLVVAYLARSRSGVFAAGGVASATSQKVGKMGWALISLLGVMVMVAPLGLLAAGSAEFEWAPSEVQALVGYMPSGLRDLSGAWSLSPLSDYQAAGTPQGAGLVEQSVGYVLSAVIGVGLLFIAILSARIFMTRRGQSAALRDAAAHSEGG